MKKSIRNIVVVGLTISSLTFSSSFSVLAASNPITSILSQAAQTAQNIQDQIKKIVTLLDINNLVLKGIINQNTATAITAYMTKIATQKAEIDKLISMTDSQKITYIIGKLVSNKIITQDQATAIATALSQNNTSDVIGKLCLSTLVSKGVITQKTSDAITVYVAKMVTQKAEIDKLKSMTDTQKITYIIGKLVSDKIITQSQATAIATALK